MRIVLVCCLAVAALYGADRKKVVETAKPGVKTPGVHVPFEKLKPEADMPQAGLLSGSVYSEALWIARKDGLVKIDPKTNKAVETAVPLQQACGSMVQAFDSLWAPDCGAKALVRVDAKTSKVKATLPVGAGKALRSVAATADSVWMLSDNRVTLTRIDPEDNRVVAELRLPAGCNTLTVGEGSLWVTCPEENEVLRVNPATNLVDKHIAVTGGPRALVIGEGAVWVLCGVKGVVARIDPKSDKLTATVDLGIPNAGGDIAAGAGSIWVTASGFPLTRIDPATDKVVQQFSGEGGGGILFGGGSLWLIHLDRSAVWRVDPKRVAATWGD